ncbi:hypothetical protein FXO38_29347 [Capsicum annuum]|nr:hypothetical protein FXO38_29347 [Capsicum annuum]KAF3653930.1 hypothetical protein FXO37_16717 [Capsicum annuum]
MFKRYNNEDSLGHEHRNDLDHSVPPITEDGFSVLKNEIANVRRHMSLFQEKVDSQFNGMGKFVEESMKLILNELRFVKQQSSEFVEKENPVVNNPVNDQSTFDDKPFFTESQLVTLEPTFRELETPKAHIATPIMFDKYPVGVYNQSDTSSRRCPLYFKSKHPFQKYIGFETPDSLIQQFTDWCYPKSRGKSDYGMFVCAFAKYVRHGIFDISSTLFGVVNHRLRYGALL